MCILNLYHISDQTGNILNTPKSMWLEPTKLDSTALGNF
jgi:hypothetical protein